MTVSPTTRRGRRFASLRASLGVRLFLLLFAVTILAFAAHALLAIHSASTQWQETVYAHAERFSDLIQRSTHYEMLQNRKDAVHQTIKTIAGEPGVEAVRIYNKSGEIIYSADEYEIGQWADLHGEACVSCHTGEVPLQAVPSDQRMRLFTRPDGHRVLGLINPIENSPECYNASCHAHPADQSVLGVLDVTMSMADADARLATAKRQVIIAGVLVALVASAFSAVFILLVVRRPVKKLIRGAERVAGGDLETEIHLDGSDEIGQLALAFNAMTRDLRATRQELTEWSDKLETRLQQKTEELSRSQRELTHMEKMASLGQLSATVAHELNNPLAGILNYAKLVDRTIRESEGTPLPREDLQRYLKLVQKEASRSGDIVRNLLLFARRSGGEFARQPLNPILERAVMLIRHHVEIASIRLETRPMKGDDHVICDADQIQQALVALMVNAVEAMSEGGTLTVLAEGNPDTVKLSVSDTGIGIDPDDQAHIFEPFFSSKSDREGAGLGLAVVYGIVQRHSGRIDVDSAVGRGTTFTITLPRIPSVDGESLTSEPARARDAVGTPRG